MTIEPEELFSDRLIAKLAEDSNLPQNADRLLFAEFVRTAATFYLQERASVTSAKIRADVNAVRQVVRPMNGRTKTRSPQRIIRALGDVSPETLKLLGERAERRGQIFPTMNSIMDPTSINEAGNMLHALTSLGGSVQLGRKRAGGKRSRKYVAELYAPPSKRNFARHGPERVAIKQLRVAWRVAAAHADPERALRAEVPATTASRENPGPFVRLVRGFFAALGVKADTVNLINSTDFDDPFPR